MLLKISPMKGVVKFELKGKQNLRYLQPFKILKKIGDIAYRLALPPSIDGVCDIFHVSMLRKFMPSADQVTTLELLEV